MGRYSRKDMIEFAKFAKSYQSSRKVEEAYKAYLGGARLVTLTTSPYKKICKANVVYLDGKIVKNRYGKEDRSVSLSDCRNAAIESELQNGKILFLKTKS